MSQLCCWHIKTTQLNTTRGVDDPARHRVRGLRWKSGGLTGTDTRFYDSAPRGQKQQSATKRTGGVRVQAWSSGLPVSKNVWGPNAQNTESCIPCSHTSVMQTVNKNSSFIRLLLTDKPQRTHFSRTIYLFWSKGVTYSKYTVCTV